MVSIITPAYNAEKFIANTIKSVISQSYQDWEMIVVNDGSNDGTASIIREYSSEDPRIKLITNQNSLGAGKARNIAVQEAKGEFIAFLDADDLWKPHKLEIQLSFMEKHNTSICFSSYELIDEEGNPLNKKVEALPVLSYNKLLKCNYIGNLTGIYNAKELSKIFLPDTRKRQDWIMWLEAVKKTGEAKGISESLAYYRVRKASLSSNKIVLLKHNFNVYRKALGFSFIKSMQYLLVFLYEYFFIKSKQTKTI